MEHAADELTAIDGCPLSKITLEAATSGELSARDLQISAETLHTQARIAHQSGYPQLAANLTRAAELTALSDKELLAMYEMLRPGRSSFDDLTALAQKLESDYQAPENARFVREAALVYRSRGLLRSE
jgi:propanediol dehydratase small subunit